MRASGLDWLWLLACCALSAAWCVTAAAQIGPTFDEPFYLRAGLEHWRTGSDRALMQAGTMPLPIDVETLPLALWERCRGVTLDPVGDIDRLLPWARLGNLLFWWLLLVYGWRIGRDLAGPWGGRLAAALLAGEPNLLAHAALATTDVAVTACLLALLYQFRLGRGLGWRWRVGVPALWYAAAVLAKASGLIWGPLGLVALELERLLRAGALTPGHPAGLRERLAHAWQALRPLRRDGAAVVALGLALMFVYCGSDWQAEPSFVAWAGGLPDGRGRTVILWVAEHLRVFSNAGEGLARQVGHNLRGHGVYVLGRWEPRAVWYYFPVALSIKLPLATLLGAALLVVARPRALANWVGAVALAYLLFTLNCRVQIGIRLVLPLVALATVAVAAGLARWAREAAPGRRRLVTAGAAAAALWMAGGSVAVWPNGLGHANELWGGPANCYRHLSDSNSDWGQGLRELVRWEERHARPPLSVWYYGTDPAIVRMRYELMSRLPLAGPQDVECYLAGRYLAVSTTLFNGINGLTPRDRLVLDYLHARRPADRTTTFLIYDFTGGATTQAAAVTPRPASPAAP
jgi:hypothetical protein